jgi:hypothetical protein
MGMALLSMPVGKQYLLDTRRPGPRYFGPTTAINARCRAWIGGLRLEVHSGAFRGNDARPGGRVLLSSGLCERKWP